MATATASGGGWTTLPGFYLGIHSTAFPTGAIRGQLD